MAARSGMGYAARMTVKLTKSRIVIHRLCPKRLWLQSYRPELIEEDASAKARMQAGDRVGEIARGLHPKGVLIEAKDRAAALAETQKQLSRPTRPLFEAAFEAGGVYVRADLLLPTRPGYRMVEVKSSGEVKDYNLEDAGIQFWVAVESGLRLKRMDLAHIDKDFVYPGKGNYRGLFRHHDVTKDARAFRKDIPKWIKAASRTLNGRMPAIEMGNHCTKPFPCPFREFCESEAGIDWDGYPVEVLPRKGGGTALIEYLRAKGYSDLRKVPEKLIKKPLHKRVWRATRSACPELDPQAGQLLTKLDYPRYYLDFETIGPSIPIWPGTSPFENIPFQWSCHIERQDGKLDHKEFLADGREDPRLELAQALIKALGTKGPIFTYSPYEKQMINGLISHLPKLACELRAILRRLVDLLPIARKYYYHREMRGSWSIKDVLPTIAPELDYSDLEVADGGMAQEAFSTMIALGVPHRRRSQLRKALLKYCGRDTLATVTLARRFQSRIDLGNTQRSKK